MAALTTNNVSNGEREGRIVTYAAGVGKTIWAGGLVCVDDATGLTEPATDAPGKTFAGVAVDPVPPAVPVGASRTGRVQKRGSFLFALSGDPVGQPLVGKRVYAADDASVSLSARTTAQVWVGDVVGVEGNAVRVRIDRAAG